MYVARSLSRRLKTSSNDGEESAAARGAESKTPHLKRRLLFESESDADFGALSSNKKRKLISESGEISTPPPREACDQVVAIATTRLSTTMEDSPSDDGRRPTTAAVASRRRRTRSQARFEEQQRRPEGSQSRKRSRLATAAAKQSNQNLERATSTLVSEKPLQTPATASVRNSLEMEAASRYVTPQMPKKGVVEKVSDGVLMQGSSDEVAWRERSLHDAPKESRDVPSSRLRTDEQPAKSTKLKPAPVFTAALPKSLLSQLSQSSTKKKTASSSKEKKRKTPRKRSKSRSPKERKKSGTPKQKSPLSDIRTYFAKKSDEKTPKAKPLTASLPGAIELDFSSQCSSSSERTPSKESSASSISVMDSDSKVRKNSSSSSAVASKAPVSSVHVENAPSLSQMSSTGEPSSQSPAKSSSSPSRSVPKLESVSRERNDIPLPAPEKSAAFFPSPPSVAQLKHQKPELACTTPDDGTTDQSARTPQQQKRSNLASTSLRSSASPSLVQTPRSTLNNASLPPCSASANDAMPPGSMPANVALPPGSMSVNVALPRGSMSVNAPRSVVSSSSFKTLPLAQTPGSVSVNAAPLPSTVSSATKMKTNSSAPKSNPSVSSSSSSQPPRSLSSNYADFVSPQHRGGRSKSKRKSHVIKSETPRCAPNSSIDATNAVRTPATAERPQKKARRHVRSDEQIDMVAQRMREDIPQVCIFLYHFLMSSARIDDKN